MAEELQYTVRFRTTNEGSGAKQAATDVAAVAAATERLNKASSGGTASRQAVDDFLSSASDKAKVGTIAFYDLDAAFRKVDEPAAKAGKSFNVSGQGLLQLAQAADDAQYGLRGVMNNVPGLVMSLGGSAGLAGGISIAVLALGLLADKLFATNKAANGLQETSQEVLTNAANSAVNVLKNHREALEDLAKQSEVQNSPDTAGMEARQKATEGYVSQLEKVMELSEKLNEFLGRQTSAIEKMAAMEEADATRRQAETQAAIDAENQKVAAAERALQIAEKRRQNQEDERALAELSARAADQEVIKLQERLQLLMEAADKSGTWSEALARGSDSGITLPFLKTEGAKQAEADLPAVQALLDEAAVRANSFRSAAEKIGDTLGRFDEHLSQAALNLERQREASKQNVETILQRQGVDAAASKAAAIAEGTTELAERLKQAVDLSKDQTGVAKQTAEQISGILADGEITSGELQKLPGLLSLLLGTYKGDVGKLISLTSDSIELSKDLSGKISSLQRDMAAVKASAANRPYGAQ